MKRMITGLVIAISLAIPFVPSSAVAGVDVHINVGPPPLPPVVFETEPSVVVVPRSRVYYAPAVSEYDVYRWHRTWYINKNGYWYRSRNYRGPYAMVRYGSVPRQILVLPAEYHRHPLHPHGHHGKAKHHHHHGRHHEG